MKVKYVLVISSLLLISGILILTGNKQKFENKCLSLVKEEKPLCWQQQFQTILKNRGVEDGFKLLSYLYKNDDDFASSCHDYTHLIGEEAYKKLSTNKKIKLDDSLSYCGYGFYHGYIISLYKDGKGEVEASEFCDYLDNELIGQPKTAILDCFHGIGHGTTDFNIEEIKNIEEVDLIIDNSVESCKKISNDKTEISRCIDGVYHSVLDGSISNENITEIFKEEGLFKFCNNQNKENINSCYGSSGFLLMYLNDNDFEKSLKMSETETSKEYASLLIRQMAGFEAYRNSGGNGLSNSMISCKTLMTDLKNECLKGIVEGVTDFGNPGNEEEEIIVLCGDNALDNKEKEFCLRHAVDYFNVYFGVKRQKELCGLIGMKYCE